MLAAEVVRDSSPRCAGGCGGEGAKGVVSGGSRGAMDDPRCSGPRGSVPKLADPELGVDAGGRVARVGHRGVLPERGRRDRRWRCSGRLRRGCRSDAACPFKVIVRRRGEGRGRGAQEAGGDLHRIPEPCRWRRGERTEGGWASREERTRFGGWGVAGGGPAGAWRVAD
jgi:hypothetical protein